MYSEDLKQFIEENRLKFTVEEMCKLIEKKFNKKISKKALRKYYYRHNLDYKKELCRRWNCTFSKPIGTESNPDENGFIRVKVSEKQWVYKQRYVYEQHYGKIPKGYKVVFLNGDKTDYSIENLAIAPSKEVLLIYSKDLNSKNPEITKLGLQVVHLEEKIKKTKEKLK